MQSLPHRPEASRTRPAGERGGAPFRWRSVEQLARAWPRRIVRELIADELADGRLEQQDGLVRLRAGVLDPDLVAALQALTPLNTVA
jgi:hypothetical protein